MKTIENQLKTLLISTLSLLAVLSLILLVKWSLMSIGAFFSIIPLHLEWRDGLLVANSDSWNLSQVLWVYLFPYLVLCLIYLIFSSRKLAQTLLNTKFQLAYCWAYLILLLVVFYMPLVEFLLDSGLYHAFNWLYIGRSIQMFLGIIMWLFLVSRIFRVSQLFSACLSQPEHDLTKSYILKQLPFLWYLPSLTIVILAYLLLGMEILVNYGTFLLGILLVVVLNTFLIIRYKVIVK